MHAMNHTPAAFVFEDSLAQAFQLERELGGGEEKGEGLRDLLDVSAGRPRTARNRLLGRDCTMNSHLSIRKQGATPPLRRVQLLRRLGEARGEAS
jgi:hypothetical protein